MADARSGLQRWFAELRRRKVFRVAAVYLCDGIAGEIIDALGCVRGLRAAAAGKAP